MSQKQTHKKIIKMNKKQTLKKIKKYNAIFMLCFNNPTYVIGSCISSTIHKLYINKFKLNIKLVIMCDDVIYNEYKDILNYYFDRVILISLIKFDINNNWAYVTDKYSSWIQYSCSKWECLKYEEYNKILFVDVDILPNSLKFYELFNYNTPSIHIDPSYPNLYTYTRYCKNNTAILDEHISILKKDISYEEYILKHADNIPLNGGLVLFTPSKNLYLNYKKFIKNIYINGIYSSKYTGPDETSLLYYFIKTYKNIYHICNNFLIIPWHNKDIKYKPHSYNYTSFIKPWEKPYFLSSNEEHIWIDIYSKMNKNKKLNDLFFKLLLNSIINYNNKPLLKKKFNFKYLKKYKINIKKIKTVKDILFYNKLNKNKENKQKKLYGNLKVDKIILDFINKINKNNKNIV